MSKFSVFKKKSRKFSTRQVFNAPLSPLLPVHPFIQRCVDFIREIGLDKHGIFRKSPSPTVVKKIIKDLNKGISVDIQEYDVHTAASLIKQYLRDLPEPLLTNNLFQDFIEIPEIKVAEEQLEKLISLLRLIPVANQILLLTLLGLFSDINDHQENNKMNYDNLSFFFGPSILYISQEEFKTFQVLNINKKLIELGLIIFQNSKEISQQISFDQQNELPFNESINFLLKNFTYRITGEEIEDLNNYQNNNNSNDDDDDDDDDDDKETTDNQNNQNNNNNNNNTENNNYNGNKNQNQNNSTGSNNNNKLINKSNTKIHENTFPNIGNNNELSDINLMIKQQQSSNLTNPQELIFILKYLHKELCYYKLQNSDMKSQLKEFSIDLKQKADQSDSKIEEMKINFQKKMKTRKEFEEKFDLFTHQIVEQQTKYEVQHELAEKQQKEIDETKNDILGIENELEKETNQGEELILKSKNEIKRIETEKINLIETSKLLESERDELNVKYIHLTEKENKAKHKLHQAKNELFLMNQYLKKAKIESVLTEKKINFIKEQFLELIEILKLDKIFYQKKKIENVKKTQQLDDEINKQQKKHQDALISKKISQKNILSIQINVVQLQKQLESDNNKFLNQEQEISLLEKTLKKLRNKK
ncbi:rho gtpase-activating protein 68f [Anaeramoeba flamelloides]|uniref:Rho gtpase-activating protein 68f n=1 Tax=Anaeramoeba flamelloides TaxID=1746091 RepID=A0ABQ8Y6F8_9EUKA|nr:rho gtpase-activating protein 68f [Anaeramoeba flamelloides]